MILEVQTLRYRWQGNWGGQNGDGDNVVSPPSDIEEGKLNSPHGLHADKAGNIFVHEWLQGTRITKLDKL
jgi:hypothetical protein